MKTIILLLFCISTWLPITAKPAARIEQAGTIVRAVLFYSPTCPHCEKVITQDLPSLFNQYGEQLQIVGVDTYTEGGQALFQAAIQRFNIPEERQAVPTLIIDETVLVGSLEIPQQLPGIIETYLAQGGVDWPDIPGFMEAFQEAEAQQTQASQPDGASQETDTPNPDATQPAAAAAAPEPTAAAGLIITEESGSSLAERLARDPAGNLLAIVVLVGMLVSLGGVVAFLISRRGHERQLKQSIAIPLLCLVGLAIAAYLAYVETAQVSAVCGPVGDCNTVQQSKYARLFGVLPIGVLGVAGYIAILLAWLASRLGRGRRASFANLALFGMALFGVIFSVYLTFLEPFVIGATCAWCLSSALIMTVLLWLSLPPGKEALLGLWYGGAAAGARSSKSGRSIREHRM
jgi:uncharacterized membrane protein